MAERRKIVIPISDEPETPHFDAEETLLSARPVVPLAPGMEDDRFEVAIQEARAPFYRRYSFLALIVLAAIAIGVAAGLGIARYRYQSRNAAPVATQPATAPAQTDARSATIQTPNNQPATHLPEVKTDEKTTVDEAKTDESEKIGADDKTKESSKKPEDSADKSVDDGTDDSVKTTPPIVPSPTREKKRTSGDEANTDAPGAQKPRERRRNKEDEPLDVQRSIQRASEQINRIREIFEGRQQRP